MRLLTTISTLLLALSLSTTAATAAELKIEKTHEVECKRKTQNGDTVHMHYRGTLASDGSQFDASYDRGTPLTFKLGTGRVIKGLVLQETKNEGLDVLLTFFLCLRRWDRGLLDMCIGEKRKLTIPPEYGYGDRGIGPIPGGATLIFETELVGIDGVSKDEL
ncbi:Peptidylprolyl isomerase [Rasamsonia emersonii CBS 393.64]|uniref:peptidylprolyl isomerase n=1 Tax=Rasamsonia emersonii (strain ATCC 16479 / CBS 393.64 / IMI 116815) TaxID=1408163 RepID=A0A0F4YK24_RASE3|nr:Peptidylprolyl isomerase [Rasamsonia emersonii CBS 393.64]KKA18617.1 Peptidylprolyl isomerase [Rasamsonia emersonii CBS 393.64]